MFETLIQNLQEQTQIYKDLQELAREKNAVLIAADTEKLSEITKEEWRLLKKAGKLETARMKLIAVHSAGQPNELDTLDKLIDRAESNEQEQLKVIKEDLLSTIENYKELNELNRQLLEIHLEYTDYMLNVFSQVNSYGNSYDSSGNENDHYSDGPIGGSIIDSEV